MRRFAAPAALAAVAWLGGRPALAQVAPLAAGLAAHQARYELKLDSAPGGNVGAVSGVMSYEVDDACDAWTTRQRLQMTVETREGQDLEMVSDYATWESKEGLSIRFRMKQTTDDAVTSETEGEASLEFLGGPGEARYGTPSPEKKPLKAGTLFPMLHTAALIEAARTGKKFASIPLFDGTSAAGAQDSFITIAGWDQPAPSKYLALSSLPSARVHISFFEPGSQVPDYEVGMRYWENGVADDLHMNFGDFVVHATLADLRPKPSRC